MMGLGERRVTVYFMCYVSLFCGMAGFLTFNLISFLVTQQQRSAEYFSGAAGSQICWLTGAQLGLGVDLL